uniref:Uncharacterized protein n=1 Tax=Podoviridae sp. ctIlt3 TaxID=2825239 RepID=A0A8S5UA96_9CAUD|nr:MAG TPA: hypothetical protein [Podoviridae sp. ctIlt3]
MLRFLLSLCPQGIFIPRHLIPLVNSDTPAPYRSGRVLYTAHLQEEILR